MHQLGGLMGDFVKGPIPEDYPQKIIDGIRLVLRLGGLIVGVALDNVYIGLALFSGVSTLVILYSFFWYIRLVKKNHPAGPQQTDPTNAYG